MSKQQKSVPQRLDSRSPTPPEPDENAKDSFYDSFFTRCGKCHLVQIHDRYYQEEHVSCSCFDGAMCCIDGFTNYAKKALAGMHTPGETEQGLNLFPKMTIHTRLHNLGCINLDHFGDPLFARKCSLILLDLLAERHQNIYGTY